MSTTRARAPAKHLKVLFLEDSPDDAELLRLELTRHGYGVTSIVVDDEAAFLAALGEHPEVIIADYNLPDFDGISALDLAQAWDPMVPFLLVSGTIDEEVAIEAMRNGAADYLIKDRIGRLGPAVARALEDRDQRRLAQEHLAARDQARSDLLASQARFRLLIEHSYDLVTVIDAQQRITYASPSARDLLGRDPAQMLGTDVVDYVEEAARPALEARLRRAFGRPGVGTPMDLRVQHADGSWRYLEAVGTNLEHEPAVAGLVLNSRDVTERVRAEERLRKVNEVLRTFISVGASLVHASEEPELLRRVCEAIVEEGGYGLACIATLGHGPPGTLELRAARARPPEDVEALFGAGLVLTAGPLRAATAGAVQSVGDLAAVAPDPWSDLARERGYRSLVALPILGGGGVWGVLAILSRDVDVFPRDVLDVLARLVDELAFGVEAIATRNQRRRYLERLEDSMETLVASLAATVELRDPYTAGHQRRVADLARAIAEDLGVDPEITRGIALAASIHDVGKVAIPAEILSRPGPLSANEFELVKTHSQAGYDILAGVEFPWPVAVMVLQHHERLDGSGYPQGLRGEDILFGSRILAVADVVEAISSHRPYRPALGVGTALEVIDAGRKVLFDPDVVDACVAVFATGRFGYES